MTAKELHTLFSHLIGDPVSTFTGNLNEDGIRYSGYVRNSILNMAMESVLSDILNSTIGMRNRYSVLEGIVPTMITSDIGVIPYGYAILSPHIIQIELHEICKCLLSIDGFIVNDTYDKIVIGDMIRKPNMQEQVVYRNIPVVSRDEFIKNTSGMDGFAGIMACQVADQTGGTDAAYNSVQIYARNGFESDVSQAASIHFELHEYFVRTAPDMHSLDADVRQDVRFEQRLMPKVITQAIQLVKTIEQELFVEGEGDRPNG